MHGYNLQTIGYKIMAFSIGGILCRGGNSSRVFSSTSCARSTTATSPGLFWAHQLKCMREIISKKHLPFTIIDRDELTLVPIWLLASCGCELPILGKRQRRKGNCSTNAFRYSSLIDQKFCGLIQKQLIFDSRPPCGKKHNRIAGRGRANKAVDGGGHVPHLDGVHVLQVEEAEGQLADEPAAHLDAQNDGQRFEDWLPTFDG
jgi:hypothetical protein